MLDGYHLMYKGPKLHARISMTKSLWRACRGTPEHWIHHLPETYRPSIENPVSFRLASDLGRGTWWSSRSRGARNCTRHILGLGSELQFLACSEVLKFWRLKCDRFSKQQLELRLLKTRSQPCRCTATLLFDLASSYIKLMTMSSQQLWDSTTVYSVCFPYRCFFSGCFFKTRSSKRGTSSSSGNTMSNRGEVSCQAAHTICCRHDSEVGRCQARCSSWAGKQCGRCSSKRQWIPRTPIWNPKGHHSEFFLHCFLNLASTTWWAIY